MTTLVSKTYNPSLAASSSNFTTFAAIKSYLASLDAVGSDVDVSIFITGNLNVPAGESLQLLKGDDAHRVKFVPEDAYAVNSLSAVAPFNNGSGSSASITFSRDSYSTIFGPGIDLYGLRILIIGSASSGSNGITFVGQGANMTTDNIVRHNRLYDNSPAPGAAMLAGNGYSRVLVADNLLVNNGAVGKILVDDSYATMIVRNTFVALNSAGNNATAINDEYNGATIRNNVFIGFAKVMNNTTVGAQVLNNFANLAPSSGRAASVGLTVVTGAGALVVDEANDWRPKSGGPLIGAAGADAQYQADILGNNRGASPDVGAWQLVPAMQTPTATITTITVTGQTVTLNGTTTGSPTNGQASLSKSAAPYNHAVSQGPVNLTLGSGTFSVTFSNVAVGQYSPTVTLSNAGGPGTVTNTAGSVNVQGATGALTSQVLDGQVLTLTGTTTGSPTSASLIVPAAASNPNGATSVGPVPVTLGSGTFSVAAPLGPGNFDPPVLQFTTAAGTSLPIPGTTAVSVLGISGNPEAPPAPATPPARTASINLVSVDGVAIAAGESLRFAWFDQVTPDSFGTPTDKGSVTIGTGGVVRVPLTYSTKASGQAGWLTVTDSDGSPDTVHKAFSGPVKVD
jgi:hypothetical protein